MIQNFKKTQVHDFSIGQICFVGQFQDIIASVGDDCFLRITDTHKFQLLKYRHLQRNYLTSINFNQGVLKVGTGSGELLAIDSNTLDILGTYNLHSDCITSILQQKDHIITASFDGFVKFTDKRTMKTYKALDLGSPITQLESFNNKYYAAGVKSFEIQNENFKQFVRFNRFLSQNGKLYGTNDENGFTCITQKQKRYVPCQNMIGYKSGVLGTSWSTVSYFASNKQDSISCLSVNQKEFVRGDSIVSLLTKDNIIYGGAESGNLYVFELDMTHSWLKD